MLRQWTIALLAATAMLPLDAMAQEVGVEARVRAPRAAPAEPAPHPPEAGPRGPRAGGWAPPAEGNRMPNAGWRQHADRPDGWQPRGDRAPDRPQDWQRRPGEGRDQPRVWRGQPDQAQGQPRVWHPDGGAGWQQRPDRQTGRDDWRARRGDDADRVRRQRDWIARSGQGRSWSDWNDHDRDRAGFYDRRDWAQGRGWYGDRNDWAGGSWNGSNWNGRGWNGGGGWNRDWRHDRRYDWNAYRASNRSLYRLPHYYAPSGWRGGYRRFGVGVSLDSILFAQDYWIDDPWSYRLPPADGPYRWVRYYNDALLVDVDSGEVVDVIHDIFW